MHRNNVIYFLLFILLVMGTFASMAQNSYGLRIMGGVALAFGLIFLSEFIGALAKKGHRDIFTLGELAAMILFSMIFGCRVFNIYFPFIEWVFVAAGLFLVFFYTRKLIIRYRRLVGRNKRLAILGLIFHLSLILFLVSMVLIPFAVQKAEWIGFCAFALLLVFIIGALVKQDDLVEGNRVSAIQMITGYRDHSIVLASLFLLFSLFAAFSKAGIIPGIYSDEFPRAYYELMNKPGSQREKTEDGKYKYQEFLDQYQFLLKRHKNDFK
ncbi:MAG: hypothetical protein ACO25B_05310 [Chitinophagaceae bacterium]